MKILLISDSHGHKERIPSILERHRDAVVVIHLGDYGTDIDAVSETDPSLLTEAVRGNNDKSYLFPEEQVVQYAGKRIFLSHGHAYNVGRDLNPIVWKARKEKADIAAFGHTHVPLVEERDGILLVNPGSIYRPRSLHGATYAILEITGETRSAYLYSV